MEEIPDGARTVHTDYDTVYLRDHEPEAHDLRRLYENAKRDQWNVSTDIDWKQPVDLDEGESVVATLEQLLDFIGNRPLVGWCVDFDVAMINRYLRPLLGFDLPNTTIELSSLYQKKMRHWKPELEPDLHFDAMADALQVPVMERHTARGDAVTAALMYLQLQRPVMN